MHCRINTLSNISLHPTETFPSSGHTPRDFLRNIKSKSEKYINILELFLTCNLY